MVGKLGLVGGVFVAWLLTFVVMGGDVMPSISADTTPTSAASGTAKAPVSIAPSATPTESPSGTVGQAAAETLAGAVPVAGQLLVDRPNARRAAPPVLTFRMATFNVLGASHTSGGQRRSRASGYARTTRAGQYVLDNKIDLIGFQELQPTQQTAFMNATGNRYALYPGNQLRSEEGDNSIAYRLDTWQLVKADTVTIPYFDGRPREMPVLLLKNKKTGIRSYFTNFHNPADIGGNQAHWRAAATAREADLFATLRATGRPVFVTGDMNERQSWFCAVAGPGDLRAAAGGEGGRDGCSVADGWRVDWIAGSHDVLFSNYREDNSSLVHWMTDHPVMVTDATIDAVDFPKSVLN